jgi:D-alanine-D-alanine ligase-like ATP-grasp enzyme
MKKFKVGLLYSAKVNAPHESADEDTPWDKWNELDSEEGIEGYARALRAGGHEVIPMEGDATLPQQLEKHKIDICFNTSEGHRGKSREAQVPSMLDMLGIPYTGSGVMALTIALDKAMTKRVLQFYSIPTPAFQSFVTGNEPVDPRLNFPLFAKPQLEGSGIGVSGKSICRTPRDLREQVRYLLRAYKEPVLVEEYIEGREITTGLLGNLMPRGAWIKERRKMLAAQVEMAASRDILATTSKLAIPPRDPPSGSEVRSAEVGHEAAVSAPSLESVPRLDTPPPASAEAVGESQGHQPAPPHWIPDGHNGPGWGPGSQVNSRVSRNFSEGRASKKEANGNTNGKQTPPAREYFYSGVRVFPPLEVDFAPLGPDVAPVYNSEIKSKNPWGPRYLIPAPISAKLTDQIGRLTVATFRALECYDFARVDFRIRTTDNKVFVLEINPLAGLTEGLSDLVMEAEAVGLGYVRLINGILEAALKRYGMLDET